MKQKVGSLKRLTRLTNSYPGIQKIIREYFENLCSSNLKNLDEVVKFLDAYNQPKLNQEAIKHLSSPITRNEIEEIIVSLQRTAHYLMESWPNFTKPFKKN
jgi:hypothetical protein